jgi:hypothetical protein
MIFTLLLISLLIPLSVTVGVSYAFERLSHVKISSSLIVIFTWLPIYFWIIQLPNIPPKQALDWVWIYVLLAGLGQFLRKSRYFKQITIYQNTILLLMGSVIIWPAISYNASLLSHWIIWLESVCFGLFAIYILFKLSAKNWQSNQGEGFMNANIHLWLITGTLGVTVIVTGSLLIGTLLISLSSVFFASGLYCKFRHNFKQQITISGLPLFYGLTLLMLLISRVYVEVDFINVLFLSISIGLSSYLIVKPSKNYLIMLAFLACLCATLGYSLYTEIISVTNNGYY